MIDSNTGWSGSADEQEIVVRRVEQQVEPDVGIVLVAVRQG